MGDIVLHGRLASSQARELVAIRNRSDPVYRLELDLARGDNKLAVRVMEASAQRRESNHYVDQQTVHAPATSSPKIGNGP